VASSRHPRNHRPDGRRLAAARGVRRGHAPESRRPRLR
jgi:hypothetical protein